MYIWIYIYTQTRGALISVVRTTYIIYIQFLHLYVYNMMYIYVYMNMNTHTHILGYTNTNAQISHRRARQARWLHKYALHACIYIYNVYMCIYIFTHAHTHIHEWIHTNAQVPHRGAEPVHTCEVSVPVVLGPAQQARWLHKYALHACIYCIHVYIYIHTKTHTHTWMNTHKRTDFAILSTRGTLPWMRSSIARVFPRRFRQSAQNQDPTGIAARRGKVHVSKW